MRRSTFVLFGLNISLAVALVLLVALATTVRAQSPSPTAPPAGAQVRRLIFVSAGFNESNRFWTVDRPSHLQFDPFLETLLDLDPKTGAFIPRLAEKWEASPDLKEWTFYLRKGVPFHFGFGEFTARDVVHAHSLLVAPEATATFVGFWRAVEEIKVVNDYQVVFRMKNPAATIMYVSGFQSTQEGWNPAWEQRSGGRVALSGNRCREVNALPYAESGAVSSGALAPFPCHNLC